MRIGYARVSTHDQNLDLQKDALKKAGCEKVIVDVASGKKEKRSGLDRARDQFGLVLEVVAGVRGVAGAVCEDERALAAASSAAGAHRCRTDNAAITPAAWPVAMQTGWPRADPAAACVADSDRPATTRLSTPMHQACATVCMVIHLLTA